MEAPTLYFAYGSNLDPIGMARRCPDSTVVAGRAKLRGWRLTFRGVADIEPARRNVVHGAVWACPSADVEALDRYEGVEGGFYRREWVTVETPQGEMRALVYVMEPSPWDNASMPSPYYLQTIARGFAHFGLPQRSLLNALDRTQRRCKDKGVTRWRHDGRKRMRPANGKVKPPARLKSEARPKITVRKKPLPRPVGPGATRSTRGMSPATLAELALERREERASAATTSTGRPLEPLRGRRIA